MMALMALSCLPASSPSAGGTSVLLGLTLLSQEGKGFSGIVFCYCSWWNDELVFLICTHIHITHLLLSNSSPHPNPSTLTFLLQKMEHLKHVTLSTSPGILRTRLKMVLPFLEAFP